MLNNLHTGQEVFTTSIEYYLMQILPKTMEQLSFFSNFQFELFFFTPQCCCII